MTRTRSNYARGFTLVELLVVVAIIGILIGMLLPAVQQVREAARRTACLNNLAQLGMAMHNYEFSAGNLPPGVIDKKGPIVNKPVGQHTGFIVSLLPFVEQGNIANNFSSEAGAYAKVNAPAAMMRIPVLECPSSWAPAVGGTAPGPSNYAGNHHSVEAPIDDDNDGLLFLNSAIRYAEIYDGSSNTILIGEKMIDASDLGWASGSRSTLRNTSELLGHGDWTAKYGGVPLPGPNFVGGFSSPHPGTCNFLMADGSVHSAMLVVDPQLFSNLGAREDGAMMGVLDW